jgi:predicted dehydrogenase
MPVTVRLGRSGGGRPGSVGDSGVIGSHSCSKRNVIVVSDPTRVAVVGVAGIGVAHLFAVAALEDDYVLTAVCDVDADAAKHAASSFSAEAFSSYDDVLAAGVADAVVIAVPPFLHGAMTRDALAAGLHVYCEKPLAPTAGECDGIAAAARASGRVVQVGCQHRFQRSYVAARELLTGSELGPPFRASLVATNWFRAQRYFDSRPWRGQWRAVGGGVLLSQAIHQVDAFIWLLGMPCRVTAEISRSLHDIEVEDEASARLHFADGARGTLVASTVDPVGTDRIEVHCEGGSLVLDGYGLRVTRLGTPASELSATCPDEFPKLTVKWEDEVAPEPDRDKEWFKLVLSCHRDFLGAIRAGGEPRVPPEQATNAVELANAVYLSALRGEPVELPLERETYAWLYDELCRGEVEVPRIRAR